MMRRELTRVIDRALIVRLATLSRRGTPLLTPLWFARDGELIYIGTRGGSPHARNIAENPRVVMLFGEGAGPASTMLRVTGTGRVRAYTEMSVMRQLKLFWRYFLRRESLARLVRDAALRRVRRRYRQERGGGVMLEFTLEHAELVAVHR